MQLLIATLMLADDVVLCSYPPKGLQHQLGNLQDFCTAEGLKVKGLD